MTTSRRELLKGVVATASCIVVTRAARGASAATSALVQPKGANTLRVLVTGGHPGDPECVCGGVIARYADMGHEVVLLYLNRGQLYCGPHPLAECASIRTEEAQKACAILKAQPVFASQVDGQSAVDNGHYEDFQKLYDAQNADVVFTQWPIDAHRDHRALSSLVLDAWLQSGRKSSLYYYEVAEDTMTFSPSSFVDISTVEPRKRAACFAHTSQNPAKWYPLQEQITRFRGTECGYSQAEGFIRHAQSKDAPLPS